jgi:hypothetical protein
VNIAERSDTEVTQKSAMSADIALFIDATRASIARNCDVIMNPPATSHETASFEDRRIMRCGISIPEAIAQKSDAHVRIALFVGATR